MARSTAAAYPTLRATVLDTVDVRSLAEFYRLLLGYRYRPGDEAPPAGTPDLSDWLVLLDQGRHPRLAFQEVETLSPPQWPNGAIPQQLHLDLSVSSAEELDRQHARVLELGGTMLLDRSADPDEALYVYADPAGHPFCILVEG